MLNLDDNILNIDIKSNYADYLIPVRYFYR